MSDQTGEPGGLVEAVAGFLARTGLLPAGSGVVVAVSGGADSTAMLDVLHRLSARPEHAWQLTVAHLDHAIRSDSHADSAHVADLARQMDLPFVTERRDVPGEARRVGFGLEQAARALRYEFLAAVAEECGAGFVATGHTADDNVETILFRLLRGTHLRGLCGIPPRRELSPRVAAVRPLLEVRREQVEDHLRRIGATWREDSTNADTRHERNFIRRELLPLLRAQVNPRVEEAVLRLSATAADLEAFLDSQAEEFLRRVSRPSPAGGCLLDARAFTSAPLLLRTHAIRQALEHLGAPMGSVRADHLAAAAMAADATQPPAVDLPGGFRVRRRGGELSIGRLPGGEGEAAPPGAAGGWSVVLACPGRTPLPDGRCVTVEAGAGGSSELEEHVRGRPRGEEVLDAEQIQGSLLCRPRIIGEAFVPLGAPGRQSVSDFLTNAKVPVEHRRAVLCISDDLGLVYLAPLRIDDRVKVTPRTRRLLRIRVSG